MLLIPVRLDDPIVAPLLDDLGAEYQRRYGANNEMASTTVDEFEPPSGLFVVLVDDDLVVAGGGFRAKAAGVCEVKRMWTRADRRRQGHGATVLSALEAAAAVAGYRAVHLETGPAQPEAVALYTARGYRPIPGYGRYPHALAFGRSLVPG